MAIWALVLRARNAQVVQVVHHSDSRHVPDHASHEAGEGARRVAEAKTNTAELVQPVLRRKRRLVPMRRLQGELMVGLRQIQHREVRATVQLVQRVLHRRQGVAVAHRLQVEQPVVNHHAVATVLLFHHKDGRRVGRGRRHDTAIGQKLIKLLLHRRVERRRQAPRLLCTWAATRLLLNCHGHGVIVVQRWQCAQEPVPCHLPE